MYVASATHSRRRKHHGGAYESLAEEYDPERIERRWKERWAMDDPCAPCGSAHSPKKYVLAFFPYPSGSGLSVGHLRNYVAGDVLARFYRMQGYDVLHPMGWDAFGLPAENEARDHGHHPVDTTRAYAANYRRQLDLVSISYDWSRELFSSDPDYYRWTQWMFLLLQRRGLVYRGEREQWWCPVCTTVLANEQVVETDTDARCWRCDTVVSTRPVKQWFVRITAYADRLMEDLGELDWPPGVLAMQRNWIGRHDEDGTVTYALRDWAISRQRFWGAPIPVVHCARCGVVPVPEHELPVRLPEVERVPEPAADKSGHPASPLASLPEFVRATCPSCGDEARRETDTLDGFACSSWYFLRFTCPEEAERPFEPEAVKRWMPVDMYIGGAEHAVMHLLYARFWTKVLFDAGLVDVSEPFAALRNQGMILDETGRKMSKSRPESVVTPDDAVAGHGADALRAYEMFIAPFEQDVVWSDAGMAGIARWLRRVWRVSLGTDSAHATGAVSSSDDDGAVRHLRRAMHQTARDVSHALDEQRFNVAVARLMTFTNTMKEMRSVIPGTTNVWAEAVSALLRLMAPIVPHIAEELWSRGGHCGSVHRATWPSWDESVIAADRVQIAVQVDGVVRGRIEVDSGIDKESLIPIARRDEKVAKQLAERVVSRVVCVPDRLINFVTEG